MTPVNKLCLRRKEEEFFFFFLKKGRIRKNWPSGRSCVLVYETQK
uniref:Uncharacterized protein n=1 Tax=Rhizophora mucronata TaxID=61149 RepID=A0A2P2LHR9_RHIMU